MLRRCATASPVLPAVAWYTWEGDDTTKWALVHDVAAALGVSPRSLQQWMAPDRDAAAHDLTDRLRVVPCAELPPELRVPRGRAMMRSTAVHEYMTSVLGRRGQKKRGRTPTDPALSATVRALVAPPPLDLPRIVHTADDTVTLSTGLTVPRDRLVDTWLAPLVAHLGYALVPRLFVVPPAAAPAAAAPAAPVTAAPVNVCTVTRRRQRPTL